MKLEHMLFILTLLAFTVAALWNVPWPARREVTYSHDIEAIRTYQRECMDRVPAHSFSLVQSQHGYTIQCEPIK